MQRPLELDGFGKQRVSPGPLAISPCPLGAEEGCGGSVLRSLTSPKLMFHCPDSVTVQYMILAQPSNQDCPEF
jgi:hypothetical protein